MNNGTISGRITRGLGQGRGFTGLAWVREAFRACLGIDPYPGTLNLRLATESARRTWAALRNQGGIRIPGQAGACDARCYPVRVSDRYPAAVVVPEVPGYPADQLELVASLGLRDRLGLEEGDVVEVRVEAREPVAAVIFDVDGTLVNSVDAYHIAAGRAVEHLGYPVTREMVCQALNGQQNFWELVIPEASLRTDSMIAGLREATMRHWGDILDEHVQVFPGLPEALRQLRDRGVRLGIYTGSRGESMPPLEAAGLLQYFEVVLTAKDVDRAKPHPEGVLRCLEQLGVSAATAAYVGDSIQDMAAGQAAGARTIGMLTGAADSAMLSAAGAHRLAADHVALLEILLPGGGAVR